MLALLLAVALIGLTVLALLLAGILVAVLSAIAVLNLCLLALGLRVGRLSMGRLSDQAPSVREAIAEGEQPAERWRPAAFRLPPEPPFESEHAPRMRIHRG